MKKLIGILLILISLSSMFGLTYTLHMYDGYGNGWDGATVDLKVNNNPTITGATVTGQEASRTFEVSADDVISTVYNAANTWFNDEASYTILNENGTIIVSDGAMGRPQGVSYTVPTVGTYVDYTFPEYDAKDISKSGINLTWNLGENCDSVDLYFSKDRHSVTHLNDDVKVIDNESVTSYSTGTLDFLTVYYWRIVTHTGSDTYDCPTQIFSTNMGDDMISVSIGDGTEFDYEIPFCTFNSISVTETIYLASDINTIGNIKGLSFFNHNSETFDIPIKIWIGETDQTDLNDSYYDASDLTLVYDRVSHFPQGDNKVDFSFDDEFEYHGGNLVVLSYRPRCDVETLSTNRYYFTETLPGRTKFWTRFGNADYDPEALTEDESRLTNKSPNINFYVNASELGSLNGTVTYDNSPLAEAKVEINGTNILTYTNENGEYSFENIPSGDDIVLTVSKHGFISNDSETISLGAGENVTVAEIELQGEATVSVSGSIVSVDGDAIEDAVVVLNGYDFQFIGTYNDDQSFTFSDVYSGHEYQVVVYSDNYQIFSETFDLGDDDYTFDHDLTIKETYFPVTNLTSTHSNNDVVLNWEIPLTEVADESNDSFETAGTFEIESHNETSWHRIGVSHTMIGDICPTDGNFQMTCGYATSPQNEMLISETMVCPAGYLTFDWYGPYNATDGDHYYVKISNNGGVTWDNIWDGSNVVVDDPENTYNRYDETIVVDINEYAGHEVKFAWVNYSPNGCDGAVYLDNIKFGVKFIPGRVTLPTERNFQNKYSIYRYNHTQENTPADWTLLAENVTELTYTDDITSVGGGYYAYAVKAIYENDEESAAVKTDWVDIDETKLALINVVSSEDNSPINEARVHLVSTIADPYGNYKEYESISGENGYISFDEVRVGTYNLECRAMSYTTLNQEIEVTSNGENMYTIEMVDSHEIIHEDFEIYDDFSIAFGEWILQDLDGQGTYGLQGITWEGMYQAQAFIIFNPNQTVPPCSSIYDPYSGDKYAASVSISGARSNDVMISKEFAFDGDARVKLMAKSFAAQYGPEEFNVYVCPNATTSLDEFVCISGDSPVQVPAEFTEFSYDIPSTYNQQNIRIAIQCVSNDIYILGIDDVIVEGILYSDNENEEVVPVVTSLKGNYPNPFNPETTISYSTDSKTSNVSLNIYNIKGQKVKTLVNSNQEAGFHTVVWNGRDNSGKAVASGVYFYKLKTDNYNSTKKMILLK